MFGAMPIALKALNKYSSFIAAKTILMFVREND
jgi:hypothetical protein